MTSLVTSFSITCDPCLKVILMVMFGMFSFACRAIWDACFMATVFDNPEIKIRDHILSIVNCFEFINSC